MGKRFFLVMVAFLAMSSVRAQRSSLCPLRMVEADSVMLYDFFWCDAARWADTIAAGSARVRAAGSPCGRVGEPDWQYEVARHHG